MRTIDRTLQVNTTPGQNGPLGDSNEGVGSIPQCSNIIDATISDCKVVIY